MPGWQEEDYKVQVKRASLNFDINMLYFDSLDYEEFQRYLIQKCKKYRLKECLNINELDGVGGLYMLVLDKYKQVYIGVSNNIKKRIKSHWNSRKSLERLIFGDICTSTLSIDSFGAMDTTRVFYYQLERMIESLRIEYEILDDFDLRYTLNRTAGGIGRDTDSIEMFGQPYIEIEVIANMRKKAMASFCDVNQLRGVVSQADFEWYLQRYPELMVQLDR